MALTVGTKAPEFTLKHLTDEGLVDVSLADNFGKTNTVLLFFPLAFSSICTDELCGIRDTLADYDALDAAVYGISIDGPHALQAFGSQNGITFPLLSDFNKEVASAYDVLFEEFIGWMKGVAKRSAFVINKSGEIIYSESSDDPKQLPDFEAIKSALKGA